MLLTTKAKSHPFLRPLLRLLITMLRLPVLIMYKAVFAGLPIAADYY